MMKSEKVGLAVTAAIVAVCMGILTYALFGCTEDFGESAKSDGVPQMQPVDESDELAQQHRSHEVEAVEAGKLDAEGNPIDAEKPIVAKVRAMYEQRLAEIAAESAESEPEPAYDEVSYEYEYAYQNWDSGSYSGYTGGATASDLHTLLNGQGRAYDENGTSYTWYPNDIGWGNIEDRVPGIHYVDEVAYDGDGYIVVAGSSYNPDAPPVEISTPYGDARIYDSGAGAGNYDVYTNR